MTQARELARFVVQTSFESVSEAADPEVYAWYIKNYGPEENLFIDHSRLCNARSTAAASGERRASGAGS